MNKIFLKSRYAPENYKLAIEDKETGVEIFIDEKTYAAKAFSGRRYKSDFNYFFKNKEQMDQYIKEYVEKIKRLRQIKIDRKIKDAAAAENCSVKVGDIFKSEWGYDQTNISYYQVVKSKGKTVEIREICKKKEYSDSMCGSCLPIIDFFLGDILKKRIMVFNGYITLKINEYERAHLEQPLFIIGETKIYKESYWSSYA
ncbi:hypothetical protein UFOVP733_12 [uncultured Caudovirales phage]|uniref:Uncharacterized protein n=1 Tax=uncultured Caudovirales phage TaxID=2100421 RepID=A0A6J7X377_9CAUD|nr:hypothetical protein UFOVP733_12 [uncultured Caudovirales phage]CAB5224952.1 hypothetical protein UFOVP743_47 [uncultured Caudovirales phage]